MDYLPALRQRLTEPMASEGSEGVPKVIQLMDDYDITKDDYDNVLDISKWPNSKDPLAHLESKVGSKREGGGREREGEGHGQGVVGRRGREEEERGRERDTDRG